MKISGRTTSRWAYILSLIIHFGIAFLLYLYHENISSMSEQPRKDNIVTITFERSPLKVNKKVKTGKTKFHPPEFFESELHKELTNYFSVPVIPRLPSKESIIAINSRDKKIPDPSPSLIDRISKLLIESPGVEPVSPGSGDSDTGYCGVSGPDFDTILSAKFKSEYEAHLDKINDIIQLDSNNSKTRLLNGGPDYQKVSNRVVSYLDGSLKQKDWKTLWFIEREAAEEEKKELVYYLRRLQHRCELEGRESEVSLIELIFDRIPEKFKQYLESIRTNWRLLNDWRRDP